MPFPALQQAIDAVFDARIGDISGRGKLAGDMREIWLMQPRFDRRTGSGAQALEAQPRFRAGYDFLRLRADSGEVDGALADWWEDYHLGNDDERVALVQAVRESAPARRVPKSNAREAKPVQVQVAQGGADTDAVDIVLHDDVSDTAEAPKRRRRRRRKPGAAAAEPGPTDEPGSS